ncbi:hypothetical protein BIW11_12537, partial [Tropilaelaps mercedesae]
MLQMFALKALNIEREVERRREKMQQDRQSDPEYKEVKVRKCTVKGGILNENHHRAEGLMVCGSVSTDLEPRNGGLHQIRAWQKACEENCQVELLALDKKRQLESTGTCGLTNEKQNLLTNQLRRCEYDLS